MLGIKDDTDLIENFIVISATTIYFYLVLVNKVSVEGFLLLTGLIIRKVLGLSNHEKGEPK